MIAFASMDETVGLARGRMMIPSYSGMTESGCRNVGAESTLRGGSEPVARPINSDQLFQRPKLFLCFDPVQFTLYSNSPQILKNPAVRAGLKLSLN